MHSNTRSTMYDRIRYEQASCKEALLAETRSLSSDLSGEHLVISDILEDKEGDIRKVFHR
jgi:hypothetical protein